MILLSKALSLFLTLAATPANRVVDRVAVVVNGEPITLSEVEENAGVYSDNNDDNSYGEAEWKALKAVLDRVIDEKLFEMQARALGVMITDSQVNMAIEDVKRRNGFTTEEELDRALSSQGIAREAFRANLRRSLEGYEVLRAKVSSRIRVADDDLRSYYQNNGAEFASDEEVRVSHIFLAVPKGASDREREQIKVKGEGILKRLKGGADFAKVAKEMSQGPSASDGGDLGFLKRGTVQPDLERVAFSLKTGEISNLISTTTGFQILRVSERRGGTVRPFEQVKEEIRDRLANQQLESYRRQFVSELRKDAVIEIRIPELR